MYSFNTKNLMIILSSLLLLFLVIGVVGATNNISSSTDNEIVSGGIDNEKIYTTTNNSLMDNGGKISTAVSIENTLGSSDANDTLLNSNDNNILTADESGTYSDLNTLIVGTDTGDTLSLDKNYVYTSSVDSNYVNGITINKQITINGNGYTIDGGGLSKLFTITGNGVILQNLNLINMMSADDPVLKWDGDNGKLTNCNLINFTMTNTGAILEWNGMYGSITYCDFKEFNFAGVSGGANDLLLNGEHVYLKYCNFTDCNNQYSCVSVGVSDCNISYCRFVDIYSYLNNNNWAACVQGQAWSTAQIDHCFFNLTKYPTSAYSRYLTTAGVFSIVRDCYFENGITAVFGESTPVNVYNCTCVNVNYPIRQPGSKSVIDNCRFINSTTRFMHTVNSFGSNGVSVTNSIFEGGTGYIYSNSQMYLSIINCTFKDLTSDYCIYINGEKATIQNCTFINNTEATAIFFATNVKYGNFYPDSQYFENNKINITSNNAQSFIRVTDIWVDNHTNGDGTQASPANWTRVFNELMDFDCTIHVLPGIYNDWNTIKEIACSVIGEGDGVIINRGSFALRAPYMQIKNIVFNNTVRYFLIGSLSTMDNCTFSNLYKTSNWGHNALFDMYGIVQPKYTNIIFKDVTVYNQHVFRSDSWAGDWRCENITFINSDIYKAFDTNYGTFTLYNITVRDSKIWNFIMLDSTGRPQNIDVSLVTMIDSQLNGFLISTSNTDSTRGNVFKDFKLVNVTQLSSGNFITTYGGVTLDGFNFTNVTGGSAVVGVASEINPVNLKNFNLYNVTSGYVVYANAVSVDVDHFNVSSSNFKRALLLGAGSIIKDCIFYDVNMTGMGDSYNSNPIVVLNDDVKVDHCNFTLCKGNFIVNGFGVEIKDSNFTGFVNATEYVNGSVVLFKSGDMLVYGCKFEDNIAYHGGAIYISNETMSNDTYIMTSSFINNKALDLGGGGVFVDSGIYFYIDNPTKATLKNWITDAKDNDLYDVGTMTYLDDVWVIPGFTDESGADGSFEHPYILTTGYIALSPYGTMHFKGDGSVANDNVYDFTGVGYYSREIRKPGLIFKGNNTVMSGVFFSSSGFGKELTFSNITFKNYTSGPVLSLEGDVAWILDCTFINNVASNSLYGVALRILGENVTVMGSSFIDNSNRDDDQSLTRGGVGSGIYCNATGLVVFDCRFEDNSVYDVGAHIYLDEGANVALVNRSSFKGSSNIVGRTNGIVSGVYVNSQFRLTIVDSLFADNYGVDGGAINFASIISNVILNNNTFKNNTANNNGGAIHVFSGAISINNCTFEDNHVVGGNFYGGAIYSTAVISMNNSYFMNNSANYGSAIYYNNNVDLTFNSCVFAVPKFDEVNNRLAGYVYSTRNVNFNNVTLSFADLNHTVATSGSDLDLMFNYLFFNDYDEAFVSGVPISKDFTINGNCFILDGNHSARIFNVTGDNTVFSNLTFRNGNATLGGAIYVIGNITILNSNFTNNNATLGGAIFIESGYSNLTNCIFDANNATNGSAIYIITSVNHWDNLDFINNIASTNATIYFREDSTVYSDNLTFTGNVIPNGLHIVGENHIYSPRIYVNQTHPGFGIIMIEPTSMEWAVDNILDNGIIIICSDYTLETIIKMNNLTNVTVTGNHTLRKDKHLFILPHHPI